ncbi:MAG: nucleotidyltransferase domain-containing protein [Candidatus Omnitrophica bacterium]|nr:nucleotidyltransferase domain-containing protein [Candidatus Omnitrophota bacterium]
MGKVSISQDLLDSIIQIIVTCKKPSKIVIFGSRAGSNFNPASDIDIAVFGKNWTDKEINLVRHDLNEFIKTPLKFDVLSFCQISKEGLRQEILKKGIVIYEFKMKTRH